MKTTLIVIAVLLVIVVGYFLFRGKYSSNQSSSTSAPVSTNSVSISNFAFDPSVISVKAGDTITFTNNDGTNHTVTADDGSFDKPISAGQSVTITISKPGTVSYHCKIHTSMKGTINVN